MMLGRSRPAVAGVHPDVVGASVRVYHVWSVRLGQG